MDTSKLRKWVIDNKIEERAIKGFYKALDNYRNDYSEQFIKHFMDFDRSKLNIEMRKVALMIVNWPNNSNDCVVAYIPIIYNKRNLGEYRIVFTLLGDIDDDYLVIE